MVWVLDAHHIDEFDIYVKFNDGKEGVINLEAYMNNKQDHSIFGLLKEKEHFKKMRFDQDLDTVVWDNGADIAPETLYTLLSA